MCPRGGSEKKKETISLPLSAHSVTPLDFFSRAMPVSRVTQAALLLAALVTGAAADGSGAGDPPCGSACTDICAPTDAECAAQGVDFVPTEVDGTCVCQSPAPAYSANPVEDFDFLSGVDALGFSGASAEHCQGGDPIVTTVSFRYQDSQDTRSFTVADLKTHLDTLEAGPVNLEVVCDFGPGQLASDDFTVTITCGADDTDGDGVCNRNDACASVQCQAFGGQPSIFTCVDTGSAAGDYQCREDPDDANDECGGSGFSGSDCGTCAAGSGWNGNNANPQCEECATDAHTGSDLATEQCVAAECALGYGVLTAGYNTEQSTHCEQCKADTYSDSATTGSCLPCPGGYTSGVGASGCLNVDECAAGTHGCDANAQCTDTDGSYSCACIAGYSGNGFSCVNVDECVAGTHGCDPNAQCDDTVGSHTCTCKAGYTGDGTSCSNVDECFLGTHGCDPNAQCDDTEGSHECTCKAGYSGPGETCTADACVASSVPGKDGSDGEIFCVNDGTVTGSTGNCGCGNVRGFSGDGNEKCERADGTPTETITINGKVFCVDKDTDGKPTTDARDRVRTQHTGTSKSQRKARKEAMRDMMKDARAVIPVQDIDADKQKKDAQGIARPAFIWLQDYTVDLVADNDYADGSATKAKFKALPAGSTLKMVVGFDEAPDTVVVSARPRKTKGEARNVDRVVLATPTSTAVLGIMNADDSDAIATAKFTGKGVDAGYDWKCRNDAGAWVDPVGGDFKEDGDTVECPIARAEPVARTFDVGSGEETTTACMQENALNYLATASYHNQTLCCVVDGCDSDHLSDAYAAASSGCGDNTGAHTEEPNGNCQTTQCTQAQLFSAYESGTCARR